MLQALEQLHAAMGSLFPTQWLIFRRERGVFNLSNIQCVILTLHERQINMDYSLCKALSYNMSEIPTALVMYDIMCQYGKHLQERVHGSPGLSLPRFSPSYIPGAKQVDGEIIETLWAPLNDISRSLRGMTLFHRQEVLDSHMNHSNWKKMVRIGMSYQNTKCGNMLICDSYTSSYTSKKVEGSGGWPGCQCRGL